MDSTYRYYILIVLIFIFLVVAIWLISHTGRNSFNGKYQRRRGDLGYRRRYGLVWKTDFSGPIEQRGKIDYVRWAVPSTEPIKCQELGYYTNNKRNLKLKHDGRYEDSCYKNNMILQTTNDSVEIEDVKGSRYYPFSTTRIISTASFHTGFFIVNVKIPHRHDGIWPYIRLIDPSEYDSNITNSNPCNDRNAYYLFKPLYHQDDSLYWTVGTVGCEIEDGGCDSDKVLELSSYRTISIGLKWTRKCLKWYLNPKMGLDGRPSGKVISKERLEHPYLTKNLDKGMTTRNLEFGIAVGGTQFNQSEEPSEYIGRNRMKIKSIEVYQTIDY